MVKKGVLELIDQLDEPETIEQTTRLLESVLKENKRLGKLLEEKHEEWLELMDEINNQETLSEYWIEQKSIDTHVDTLNGEVQVTFRLDDLQNLLVPKQELPVIPKFVADLLEEYKAKEPVITFYGFIKIVTNLGFKDNHSEEGKFTRWLTNKNEELLMRAWLDGYEVEEEQKYYVMNNEKELLLSKNNDDEVITYSQYYPQVRKVLSDLSHYQLTEQEIKDYDERYWSFRKPIEELEK